MKKRSFISIFFILLMLFTSGCKFDFQQMFQSSKAIEEKPVKVEIIFTDGESLVGYIKSLGIEENGRVYVGGSSLNYLYDKNGNIIGSYNYQRVLYIKLVPEETPTQKNISEK